MGRNRLVHHNRTWFWFEYWHPSFLFFVFFPRFKHCWDSERQGVKVPEQSFRFFISCCTRSRETGRARLVLGRISGFLRMQRVSPALDTKPGLLRHSRNKINSALGRVHLWPPSAQTVPLSFCQRPPAPLAWIPNKTAQMGERATGSQNHIFCAAQKMSFSQPKWIQIKKQVQDRFDCRQEATRKMQSNKHGPE